MCGRLASRSSLNVDVWDTLLAEFRFGKSGMSGSAMGSSNTVFWCLRIWRLSIDVGSSVMLAHHSGRKWEVPNGVPYQARVHLMLKWEVPNEVPDLRRVIWVLLKPNSHWITVDYKLRVTCTSSANYVVAFVD